MLKNERGWNLQHHELYPLLGLKSGSHLPDEGFGPVEVQGITFVCRPAGRPTKRRWDGTWAKPCKHRIYYLCEVCERWIPFGRAGQHRKGTEHKANSNG